MTTDSLTLKIKALIKQNGAISLSELMTMALYDIDDGYYMTKIPFGKHGDFTTSPEISQMFGEILGLWCSVVWQQLGCPSELILAELGPGRAGLASDALRAIKKIPKFYEAINGKIHLVEISPLLREIQSKILGDSAKHYDDIEKLPPALPMIVLANEFFDALPIEQYIYQNANWHQRLITLDKYGQLIFTISDLPVLLPISYIGTASEGAVLEYSPAAGQIIAGLAKRFAATKGAALFIDYGDYNLSFSDTLQALSRHQFACPLTNIGQCDITSHVNFAHLALAAKAVKISEILEQGLFLKRLGIIARAEHLSKNTKHSADINNQLIRLTSEAEMGKLCKVMAIASHDLTTLPGFLP